MSITNRLNLDNKKDLKTVAIMKQSIGERKETFVCVINNPSKNFVFIDISEIDNIIDEYNKETEVYSVSEAWTQFEKDYTVSAWTTTDKILELLND